MLRPLSPEDSRRLVDFFSESGYNLTGVTGRHDLSERPSRYYGTIDLLLERTADPCAFHTLVRWFTIGVAQPEVTARQHLPLWAIELLVQSGLLRRREHQLEPTAMLSPLGTMLVASDPVLKWEDNPADLVIWPNPTTHQLFNFTVRKEFESALDLGCGCGVQALGAAPHCESVLATDLNPRAAEFTAFNARLNGIENVRSAAGDCFDPAGDSRFDLIVANPPFFITPSSGLTYCENDLDLDLFSRRLAREAPAHLTECGFFQMICEWVEIEGQPWRERIAEWMNATGCDAWVIKQYTMTPSKYGSERSHQRPPGGARAFYSDWIAYSHRNQIIAIHGGLITMRKRTGANWLRIDDRPVSLDAAVGDLILAGFRARDVLDSNQDGALLEARPRLAAGVRLVQLLGASGQGWKQESLRLHLAGGMPRQIDIDPGVAEFIAQFDGIRKLGDVIQAFAQKANAPPGRVTQESLAVTKRLLSDGYVEI